MRSDASNPDRNQLPKGIDELKLVEAIEVSGYPLQGIVASKLVDDFTVTEEWGYIDRDSKDHRSLDVFAGKILSTDSDSSVRPRVALLIECKRSHHPYVFFNNVTERPIQEFPYIAGLPSNRVAISEQSGRSLDAPGALALGLDKLPFVEAGPPNCAAFSKAVPTGKKISLSGTDPFNSLILPLMKALDHASQLYEYRNNHAYITPTLVFCISVLDAPMILVENPETPSKIALTPWLRVTRQEANPDPRSWHPGRSYTIDAVHIEYLNTVIYDHIVPAAEEFSKRAVQLGDVLFDGGVVPDLSNWEWNQIQKKTPK